MNSPDTWIKFWEAIIEAGPYWATVLIIMAVVVLGAYIMLKLARPLVDSMTESFKDLADRYEKLIDKMSEHDERMKREFEEQIEKYKVDNERKEQRIKDLDAEVNRLNAHFADQLKAQKQSFDNHIEKINNEFTTKLAAQQVDYERKLAAQKVEFDTRLLAIKEERDQYQKEVEKSREKVKELETKVAALEKKQTDTLKSDSAEKKEAA